MRNFFSDSASRPSPVNTAFTLAGSPDERKRNETA
jgi:hypothetical protein